MVPGYNDAEDVLRALSSQVDVNASDEAGRTGATTSAVAALHNCLPCCSKAAGRARLVLAALHMAAANGHSNVVKILLDAGAVNLCLCMFLQSVIPIHSSKNSSCKISLSGMSCHCVHASSC